MWKMVLVLSGVLQMASGQAAVSKENAEHYTWGQQCDGWYLVKDDQMTIIEERMPPGTAETLHQHAKSRQFFFVLLKIGRVAAAGLDVYEREPKLNPGYIGLKNTFLLPHIGWATIESRTNMGMVALDNIYAVLNGKPGPSLAEV